MVDWEITATTILCEDVDDEVTLIVNQDGNVKCTGEKKYARPDKATSKAMKKKSRRLGRQVSCKGVGCARATQYRDGLLGKK
ncbi:MAG: hypothetical protein ABR886_10030 [Dehalococcoidales bacterium]|jgi:hypothetical protein